MAIAVLTPAKHRRLATVAGVRADLGAVVGTATDDQITRWIDQASGRAAAFCRRTFGREAVRERLDGRSLVLSDDRLGLRLDRGPVVSVTALSADGVAITADGFTAEGPWLYRLDGEERSPWPCRPVVVDYVAGWVLPEDADHAVPAAGAELLPIDVERAVCLLVAATASAAGRDQMLKSESIDGVMSQSWYVQGATAALPHPEAESILRNYRRALTA